MKLTAGVCLGITLSIVTRIHWRRFLGAVLSRGD